MPRRSCLIARDEARFLPTASPALPASSMNWWSSTPGPRTIRSRSRRPLAPGWSTTLGRRLRRGPERRLAESTTTGFSCSTPTSDSLRVPAPFDGPSHRGIPLRSAAPPQRRRLDAPAAAVLSGTARIGALVALPRLVRRDDALQWWGAIHETVACGWPPAARSRWSTHRSSTLARFPACAMPATREPGTVFCSTGTSRATRHAWARAYLRMGTPRRRTSPVPPARRNGRGRTR